MLCSCFSCLLSYLQSMITTMQSFILEIRTAFMLQYHHRFLHINMPHHHNKTVWHKLHHFYLVLFFLVSLLFNIQADAKSYDKIRIPFDQSFGQYQKTPGLTTWQMSIPIDIKKDDGSAFKIQWGSGTSHIKIFRETITFYDSQGKKVLSTALKKNVHTLHLVFESDLTERYQIQLVQSKRNMILDATPYLSWEMPKQDKHPNIYIEGNTVDHIHTNDIHRMVGNADVMNPIKTRRDTWGTIACFHPVFNVLAVILNTGCNLDYVAQRVGQLFQSDKKGYAYIDTPDGNTLSEKPSSSSAVGMLKKSSATLHSIIRGTADKPFLSAYAAAKTCSVPLTRVFSNRKPRGQSSAYDNDCVYSTEQIITLYTRIFGTTSSGVWNREHFNNIISNILRTGKTGETHISSDDENALVGAVLVQHTIAQEIQESFIRQLGNNTLDDHDGWLAELGFAYAQQGYASYVQTVEHTSLPAETAPPILTPQELQQQGAAGTYYIDVANFRQNELPIRPARVFRQNQWTEDHDHAFQTEIINVNHISSEVRTELNSVIDTWDQQYRHIDPLFNQYSSSEQLHLRALGQIRATGALATTHLHIGLLSGETPVAVYPEDHTYFAVTRYQNRIVSMFMFSDIEDIDDNWNNWEIDFAVTEPQSVIPLSPSTPETYHEGAVRGAGQATLRALLTEAQRRHIHSIRSNVVSIPSALMFQKTGFTLIFPVGEVPM